MEIRINADAIPEIMQEFITDGEDGVKVYDYERAFKALKEEREGRRADRKELATYKGIGKSIDELTALANLGKTPDELVALMEAAASGAADLNKLSEIEKGKLTAEKELKTLRAELEKIQARQAESDRLAADAKLRALVEGLIDQLPPEQDKDKHRLYWLGGKTQDGLSVNGVYQNHFKVNAIGDIEDIGEKSPVDYISAVGNAMNFRKTSTPGGAHPGNSSLNQGGRSAAFANAQKSRDVMAMLEAAPDAKSVQ